MDRKIQILDVVSLMVDLPQRGLVRSQVGTVVESLAPDVFEVEFRDDEGRTYAILALPDEQLMVLHHRSGKKRAIEGNRAIGGQHTHFLGMRVRGASLGFRPGLRGWSASRRAGRRYRLSVPPSAIPMNQDSR